jgi:uncharacterized protein involved in exopolysaccharide biosynthesis
MSLLVNRERLDPLVTPEASAQMVTSETPITEEEINSEAELLKSYDVLEKVVKEVGLDKDTGGFSLRKLLGFKTTPADRTARAVKGLAKQLKIEVVVKTNLISITYSSPDPERSYKVLTSLGEYYRQKHIEVHRPVGSFEFFAGQAEQYHTALQNAEDRLRQFGTQSGVAAPDMQRNNLALQVATSIGLLHAAQQAIASDEERIVDDQKQISSTAPRSPTAQTSAPTANLLDQLNASLLAVEARRAVLVTKYEPTYPLVQEADQEIAEAKDAIAKAEQSRYISDTTDRDPTYELLREDIARTMADLAGQRANLSATTRSIESMQAQMVDLDQKAITQGDLERDAKVNESSYLLYVGKREQERSDNALDVTRISNIAIAVPPAIPVLPALGWGIILIGAFGASAVLSVGAGYASDYFDSSFNTPDDVLKVLDVPVVISVLKRTA